MHQSVATIDSPQFLNLQPLDINPLMSKCEIKVFYVGANRNGSFISQEVAAEIGKTLRGAPIVGYYKEKKEDFADHGEKVIIDDEGIKFECQTVPYGFVSPDAKVWFQNFEDHDGMGNTVVRKYLMTTGYLWTGQFPESSLPVKEGRPQSMELHSDTLQGEWHTNYQDGLDYFIINDAIIQKICILGDDVEPCFEGASVTSPDISSKFTLDKNFKQTLYSMMKDLQEALNEGGKQMDNLENVESVVEQTEEVIPVTENTATVEVTEEFTETESKTTEESEETSVSSDFEKEEQKQDTQKDEKKDDQEEDKKEQKYTLLENEFNELKDKYSKLESEYSELLAFKKQIDNEKKDALIADFYMLSDEDKAEVVSNKEKYSLDEIKAKLSVICFDKKINFSLEDTKKTEEQNIVTFVLDSNENANDSLPDWVKAVKEQEKLG